MTKEYYKLLGVSENASQKEIKKAYRKKAKKFHPDSNSDTADEEKFKKINKAYDILGDEEKRAKYDQFGKAGVTGNASAGHQRAASNFQDIFEQIFGGGQQRRQQTRGKNLKVPLTITLKEAYKGVEKKYEIERNKKCNDCNGSGAKDEETKTCSQCNGDGRVRKTQRTPLGRTQVVKECEKCHGTGKIPEKKCKTCNGKGVSSEKEKITFEIPAGIKDGQRIQIQNKGHENRKGRSGNLFVYVTVEEHDNLERQGDDLYTTLTIGVGDAALGAEASIPHPDKDIQVKIPSGTQPGQVLRVSGKGMPKRRRGSGDLYIKIDVEIPEKLNSEQKDVFKELRTEKEQTNKSFFETVKDMI